MDKISFQTVIISISVKMDTSLPRWDASYMTKKPIGRFSIRRLHLAIMFIAFAVFVGYAFFDPATKSIRPYLMASKTDAGPCFECSTVLGIKTGLTIAHARLPAQMMEDRKDIPNQRIFADADFQLGSMHIEDTYKTMDIEVQRQAEFATYFELQQNWSSSVVPDEGRRFWQLARYCEVALFGHLFRATPNMEWYLVRDDDTFFFWKSIMRFLQHFNASEPHVFGRFAYGPRSIYAQGGAGYMVSKAVMQATYGADPRFEHRFTHLYPSWPWGDEVFGAAMFGDELGGPTTGNKVTNLTRPDNGDPMMHEDHVGTLPFGPHTWYFPVLSITHLHSKGMWQMRQFEQEMAKKGVREDDIRFCDLYDHYASQYNPELSLKHILADEAPEWLVLDNRDGYIRTEYDVKVKTWSECQQACEADRECSSVTWIPDEGDRVACRVGRLNAFIFGGKRTNAKTAYNVKRIRKSIGAMPCHDQEARAQWYAKALELGHTDRVF